MRVYKHTPCETIAMCFTADVSIVCSLDVCSPPIWLPLILTPTISCEKMRLQASMVLNRGVNAREIFTWTHTHTHKLQKQNHKTKLDMSGMDEKYRPNKKREWKKNGKREKEKEKGGEWNQAKCYATDNDSDNNSRNEFPMAIGYMQTTHINIAEQNANWKSFLHSKTFVKFPIISTCDK